MNITTICPICGIDFNKKTKTQVCCTIKCKKQYTIKQKTKQCLHCKKEFIQHRKDNKFCSPKCSTDYTRKEWKVFECKQCGKEFREKNNSNNIFCSKKCSGENIKLNSKPKLYCKLNIKLECKLYINKCIECGKIFTSQRKRKYCSLRCAYDTYNTNKRNKYIKQEYKTRLCKLCDKEFKPLKHQEVYCSDECRKEIAKQSFKNHEHKRRTRIKEKFSKGVSLYKIKQRDGNKCLICGVKVLDKNVSGYYERNGTIGHLMPLSKGGEHSMRNVQLECQKCNNLKGAKAEGQLRLW